MGSRPSREIEASGQLVQGGAQSVRPTKICKPGPKWLSKQKGSYVPAVRTFEEQRLLFDRYLPNKTEG